MTDHTDIEFIDPRDSDMLQRAPLGAIRPSSTAPLIVTPTFVSRTDATPEHQRAHDAGSGVDKDGKEVRHPDQHPERLALEPNLNLAFEHWDEYWRKVHGPKFAYEEPGTSNDLVVRYDQVHRIASGPSSAFRPPYRAQTVADGRLQPEPARHVPTYHRPDWDGFAYIAYGQQADIEKTLSQAQYAERIIADEQTAFRMVTRELAREYILIPSATHREPISLVKLHFCKPGVSRQAFQDAWLHGLADEVMVKAATQAYVKRYVQLHPFGSSQEDPEGSKIDGISVFSFATLNDAEDFVASRDWADLEAAESAFTDAERSNFWTAINYVVINRVGPELATDR
jgi:hypothetical protein